MNPILRIKDELTAEERSAAGTIMTELDEDTPPNRLYRFFM